MERKEGVTDKSVMLHKMLVGGMHFAAVMWCWQWVGRSVLGERSTSPDLQFSCPEITEELIQVCLHGHRLHGHEALKRRVKAMGWKNGAKVIENGGPLRSGWLF